MNGKTIILLERTAAVIAALIFLQTLYFKFTAHPDSVHIFTEIGGEPYIRIGSGIVELIIAILLLFRTTTFFGALLGFVLMIGAIAQHLLVLGIVVNNDGGALFALAVTTLLCCGLILWINRKRFRSRHKK